MTASVRSNKIVPIAWLIWGLAAFYYFAQYSLRLVPSVIQSDLVSAFSMTPTVSGYLGGAFYLPYIAMQVPIGALVDKFGAKVLLGGGAFFVGLSAFLFATAESLPVLFLSRFLLGLCAASGFVCALKLATIWFPATLFGLIVGITQALGMLGGSLGWVIEDVNANHGYPPIFWVLGSMFILLSILSFIFVSNGPKSTASEKQSGESVEFKPLMKKVFFNRYTWINAMYAGLIYAPSQVFGEYWGPTFFTEVYGVTTNISAKAISMMFFGSVIGGPLAGKLSDLVGRRPVMILSAISWLAILSIMFMGVELSVAMIYGVCFVLGMTNTGLIAAYATSGELHDSKAAGLSMSVANIFSILIGALLIPICGSLLDMVSTGAVLADGTRIFTKMECLKAFSLLPLCSLGALICALMMKETHPKLRKDL